VALCFRETERQERQGRKVENKREEEEKMMKGKREKEG